MRHVTRTYEPKHWELLWIKRRFLLDAGVRVSYAMLCNIWSKGGSGGEGGLSLWSQMGPLIWPKVNGDLNGLLFFQDHSCHVFVGKKFNMEWIAYGWCVKT